MRFFNGLQVLMVVARRYEHGSIILTTNRNIASWSAIFEDAVSRRRSGVRADFDYGRLT